jgi:hypothetical protein
MLLVDQLKLDQGLATTSFGGLLILLLSTGVATSGAKLPNAHACQLPH